MSTMNRLANCHNKYQGTAKKVLCVCSAGLLRSPTTAFVLAQEYGFNTRAAGYSEEYALIVVDDVLLEWADEIVVMDSLMEQHIEMKLMLQGLKKPVINLDIDDQYPYMDPKLVNEIKAKYPKE